MLDIDISKITNEVGEPTARFVESEKDKQQRIMIMIFSAVFVGIFVLGTLVFAGLEVYAKNSNKALVKQVTDLKTENSKLLAVERDGLSIVQRNKNAETLLTSNPWWSAVFEEIEDISPKNVAFSRFETGREDILRVSGSADSYSSLAKLLVSLNTSPFFDNATLSASSMSVGDNNKSRVEFAISVLLKKDITMKTISEERQKLKEAQGVLNITNSSSATSKTNQTLGQ